MYSGDRKMIRGILLLSILLICPRVLLAADSKVKNSAKTKFGCCQLKAECAGRSEAVCCGISGISGCCCPLSEGALKSSGSKSSTQKSSKSKNDKAARNSKESVNGLGESLSEQIYGAGLD